MRYPTRDELIRLGLAVFAVYLGIYYWSSISHALMRLTFAFSPVALGASIAYIANIPMRFFERHLAWMGRQATLAKLRRPVSLLASIAIVLASAFFLVWFIAPELTQSVHIMSMKIPFYVRQAHRTLREMGLDGLFGSELDQLNNWQEIREQLSGLILRGGGTGDAPGSLLRSVSTIMSSTISLFLSIVLAIYVLMGKERLGAQVHALVETYLGPKVNERLTYVCEVVDHSFYSFVVGRCLVALLLGIMCTAGMLLFRFPYAMTIGTVVGVTYIVPVVGGYVGAIIGALLIFSISPVKAALFVLFILVLEQIEANVVFPQVVGSSTGLPGIWVLAAVAVGGELGGVPFVLLSVPVAASIYQLVGDDMRRRTGADANP